jgi:hypothetical protein
MVVGPFTVHEHYVFGLMALILVALTQAPKNILVGIGLILAVLWLPSVITNKYVLPAGVSTTDRIACISSVCANFPQPIYVVTNGPSHDHQGLGYAYLAQKEKCDMFAVTQWKDQQPKTMVVMNENNEFDMQKTDFYELNRFGQRQFVDQLNCGQNVTATIFTQQP